MYKLPRELHLSELVGQEINLISVGAYDAQVAFEKGVVIQALHKLEGEVAGVREIWFDGEWLTTDNVMNIPKQEVIAVSNESDFILKVQLSNEIALFFHTEESQYESINITRADGTLEVI